MEQLGALLGEFLEIKMKFIGRLFMWFASEAITGVLSQAIADAVSKNPFIYYPLFIILFAIGSLASTIGWFNEEIKNFN